MTVPRIPQTENLVRILRPLQILMTPEFAKQIIALTADEPTQNRIDDLSERHKESELTDAELDEYKSLVDGINLISVLQGMARAVVNKR